MTAQANNKTNKEDVEEETFEYKLNHIVQTEDNNVPLLFNEKDQEYYFPEIELFSYELSSKEKESSMGNYDSGTNLLYFYIQLENLNKNYEDTTETEKKPLLELFLNNLKPLIDNFVLTKTFQTDCGVGNIGFKTVVIKLQVVVEFDPVTLTTVYTKIVALLKNIISFKVLIEHKWKTIFKYFPEMEKGVKRALGIKDEKEEEKSEKCCIF
jgi:hypothetical protein